MKLHTYFRSSAAYRVRIALALKDIAYEPAYVHLIKDGGQHKHPAYLALNPQGLVPALEVDGTVIAQSAAILEYLEETHPTPALLPSEPLPRARVRAFMHVLIADTHPLNNLRVLNYLKGPLAAEQSAVDAWARHWIGTGLAACEAMLPADKTHPFCFSAEPSLADVCLVPQMFSARRFELDLSAYPRLVAIDAQCRSLAPFAVASPERQADAG